MITVSEAMYDTVKQMQKLHEVANLHELSQDITIEDLKRPFKYVIKDFFETWFDEEIKELEAYERAEQHRADMWFENNNSYLMEKDGE